MQASANYGQSNHVILVIDRIDRLAIHALRFAQSTSGDITAFGVAFEQDEAVELLTQWEELRTGIPFHCHVLGRSGITESLLRFIQSGGSGREPNGTVTVVLPRLAANKWWFSLLHNGMSRAVERKLLRNGSVGVAIYSYPVFVGGHTHEQDKFWHFGSLGGN